LDELNEYDLGARLHWESQQQLIEAAEKLVRGDVDLGAFQRYAVRKPFRPADMASGPTKWQLFLHSLGLPRVLLDAYRLSSRPQFLQAAADYVLAYDQYESSGWHPGGYLWSDDWKRFPRNDHAIAARSVVLSDFWRLYRQSPGYRPVVGDAVFRMVTRFAHLLTKPSHFTFATNHGVMQNLAACHLALAFPRLRDAQVACETAIERFQDQLRYLMNDEGFVLEHSPGYQGFGLRLIGIMFRYMTLLGHPIPDDVLGKYEAGQRVYAAFRRPGGSLPRFGDTDSESDRGGPAVSRIDGAAADQRPAARSWRPSGPLLVAPVAGYAVWWSSIGAWPDQLSLSQTAVTWSNIRGMGHKHADELSLSLWAGGMSWWENVGYWPYDAPGREIAESWGGANAPHLDGEPYSSARTTVLRYHGHENDVFTIDLERVGPGTYTVRRQVVVLSTRTWIVIDTSSGVPEGTTRTIWTTSPDVELDGGGGVYLLSGGQPRQQLRVFFQGSPGTTIRNIRGSYSPFGGWAVLGGRVLPASAVLVEQPASRSWALTCWSWAPGPDHGPGLTAAPIMTRWHGAEDWQVALQTSGGPVVLERTRGQLTGPFDSKGGSWPLTIRPGPAVDQPLATLRAARTRAAATYGVGNMSGLYRVKATGVLLAAVLICIIAQSAAAARWPRCRLVTGLGFALTWLLLVCYLVFWRTNLFWPTP
jgi:hypothetical protein